MGSKRLTDELIMESIATTICFIERHGPERPFYSRDELIDLLVDRDLNNQLRRAFAKLDATH